MYIPDELALSLRTAVSECEFDNVRLDDFHELPTWLTSLPTESHAFIAAIGSGPWALERRLAVRERAFSILEENQPTKSTQCISTLTSPEMKNYDPMAAPAENLILPLNWQRQLITNIQQSNEIGSFNGFIRRMKMKLNLGVVAYDGEVTSELLWDYQCQITKFFHAIGQSQQGSKVTWLFLRDYFDDILPAFPIDRHVKRWLGQYKLPVDPWMMCVICLQNGINPNALNREIVKEVGLLNSPDEM